MRFKRLSAILIVFIVMLGLLALPISAEEVAEPENTPVTDVIGDGEANTPTDGVEENNTVLARVYEWAGENISEIITLLSGTAMAAYAMYQRGKNGTLINGIGRVLKSQGGVETATQAVSSGMEEIKALATELNGYYKDYSENEAERNKVTAALLVEVMSLIELQHIAFINNSSIPQSLKNLATSKYARCLSVINDDTEIKAAYDEMRGILGITEGAGGEETNT